MSRMEKIIVMDIWGAYAHFKKPYTTTSPISYSIPSRTTITGILGAILGIPKGENNSLFADEKAKIGIGVKAPIKKVMIAQNLIDTKRAKKMARINGRTQIRFEYIKEPRYRFYIQLEDEQLASCLENKLKRHESIYTLSLGLSENLANFKYRGTYDYTYETGAVPIHSAINLTNLSNNPVIFTAGKEYFVDRFALQMTEDREVTRYGDLLFERNGKAIDVNKLTYIALENGENILFM